ncbi:MAG: hypothetical protein ACC645_09775 [Pirellulales bacterium]
MNTSTWAPYVPTDAEPWDLRRVVHLHRRAGSAATWTEIQRDLQGGPEAAVRRVLTGTARSLGVPEDFAAMADLIGDAAVAAGNVDRLKAWWVYRMLFSPDPPYRTTHVDVAQPLRHQQPEGGRRGPHATAE